MYKSASVVATVTSHVRNRPLCQKRSIPHVGLLLLLSQLWLWLWYYIW